MREYIIFIKVALLHLSYIIPAKNICCGKSGVHLSYLGSCCCSCFDPLQTLLPPSLRNILLLWYVRTDHENSYPVFGVRILCPSPLCYVGVLNEGHHKLPNLLQRRHLAAVQHKIFLEELNVSDRNEKENERSPTYPPRKCIMCPGASILPLSSQTDKETEALPSATKYLVIVPVEVLTVLPSFSSTMKATNRFL